MKDYEQIISTLLTRLAELEQVVKQQAAKIADLEKRLNKNSSNSSKPPSSDVANTHNNVLYVGVTSDLIRRIYEHKNKLVKGFTQK